VTEPIDPRDAAALARLADVLTTLVSEAAGVILTFDPDRVDRRLKRDRSPVTAADEAAESLIMAGLALKFPGVAVISEEASGAWPAIGRDASWLLVDPLDGTREFLAGRGEFTVNIALIREGRPTLGCIAAPASGLVWRGGAAFPAERLELAPGAGIDACQSRTPIRARPFPEHGGVALVSRSHFDARSRALLGGLPVGSAIGSGSSLKFCRLAEGAGDVYPRLAPTHEWDIAAGHAILVGAGGVVLDELGQPLGYGHAAARYVVPGFVAWGDAAAAERFATHSGRT
jgi:3'(2'), 5'-bisphosphate nucleotidase